ncbi:MAG: hypothetical protein LBD05_00285 [Mycoplasmataceae bacterium]|nr:hypothetical protein [Mycoplasmataceae bacterium]
MAGTNRVTKIIDQEKVEKKVNNITFSVIPSNIEFKIIKPKSNGDWFFSTLIFEVILMGIILGVIISTLIVKFA